MADKKQTVEELLSGLLASVGQKTIDEGKTILDANIGENSPLSVLGKLIGIASTARLGMIGDGEGKRLGGEVKKQVLDPFMQGAEKALKNSGEAFAQESIMKQGPEATVAKFNEMASRPQSAGIPSPMGQPTGQGIPTAIPDQTSPQVAPEQNIDEGQRTMLSKLLISIGSGLGAAGGNTALSGQLLTLADAQEARKNQLSDFEKLKMEYDYKKDLEILKSELSSVGSVDKLNPESASKFAMLTSGYSALERVGKMIDFNKNVIAESKVPGFLKSQEGRQFIAQLETAFTNKLRIESGATISDKEIRKQWKEFAPKLTDSMETIRQRIQPIREFYSTAIEISDPSGAYRKQAGSGKPSGNIKSIKPIG